METTLDHPNALSNAQAPGRSRRATGATLSGIAIAFLLFDSSIKLMNLQPVVESFERLGYPTQLARGIGLLELCCLGLYVVPRTAALGAVLLTGFLGGAITTHLRVGDPWLSHTCFPLYVALLLWGGLHLRDARPGALLRGAETPR